MKENRVNVRRSSLIPVRTLVLTAAMLACVAAVAPGQQCDTGDQCMTNGMCMPDGTCQGTPLNSGSCDLASDLLCMVNGHCVNGECVGDPAPDGTSCASGCGTCQPPFPGVPVLTCLANPAQLGKACESNLGACFTAVCQQFGQPPVVIAECLPQPKQCPDIDNNPCTTDACNPATGMCEHSNAPPCVPQCETCNPATLQCEPANIGAACNGIQSECPVETSCQVLVGRGLCLAGTPSSGAPTPTGTPTPTPTAPPVPTTPPRRCRPACV
jgi:Dictyostelium (slime mold) repeat